MKNYRHKKNLCRILFQYFTYLLMCDKEVIEV